jgi:hypothetical protein
MGVTSTGLGVGKTLVQLGRLVEARDKLLAVSRLPASPDESPILTRARTDAASLQRQIAPRIAQLSVALRDLPEGVEVAVTIDGERVPAGMVELPRALDPGEHQVVASGDGVHTVRRTVNLGQGEKHALTLTFERAAKSSGGDDEPTISPLVYAGFAVAGAGIVVGAITGGISLSIYSSVKEDCDDAGRCPTSRQEDGDRSLALAHVSTASFALAGAGAIVGAVGLFLTFGGDDTAADTAWQLGPGYLGVSTKF